MKHSQINTELLTFPSFTHPSHRFQFAYQDLHSCSFGTWPAVQEAAFHIQVAATNIQNLEDWWKLLLKKNKIKWSFHTMHIKISRSLLYTSDQRQSCEQELPHWTFKVQFLSISSRVLFPSKNTRGNKDEIMMKEGWFFPPKSHVYENISISLLWWFLTLSPRSQMQSPFSLKLLFFRNRTNKTTYMDFKLPAAHCLISKDFCERYC